MYTFNQNDELTYIDNNESLVAENSFIGQEVTDGELPVYEESISHLPQPIWDGHQNYLDCYWRAWEIAFSNLKRPEEGSGFVSNFIDTAFNGALFMWDSAFILMFGKYGQRVFNFQKTLDNIYSHQHKDGYICRAIYEDSGKDRYTRFDPSATGPEILAWSEWEYFLNFGDRERLERVFPPLMAYHHWMAEFHTWPDGSYFSSGWGCGMDNIPRVMPGYSRAFSHGHMVWADTCMQEIHNCNMLLNMAKTLGRLEFVNELEEERDNLLRIVNEKLWDEETAFYYDLWKNGELNYVQHIGTYWALISECITPEKAERMIAHLEDEEKFKSPNRVPSLIRSHERYNPNGEYWCGGVWAPTNYMVLKGLDKYQKFDLAHDIAKDYLRAVVSVFEKTGTLFENYAPEYVDGEFSKGSPAKPDFVGWTGLAPISILFEYVFGIKPNAEENKIEWHINLTEKHGVEKYPFGNDGELTLICNERKSIDEEPEITFKSNVPVTLEIVWGTDKKRTVIVSL